MNNREEISQGDAGKGRQSITTRPTVRAAKRPQSSRRHPSWEGSARRRPASLYLPNPFSFLSSVSKTVKWSKKPGIPATEPNSQRCRRRRGGVAGAVREGRVKEVPLAYRPPDIASPSLLPCSAQRGLGSHLTESGAA